MVSADFVNNLQLKNKSSLEGQHWLYSIFLLNSPYYKTKTNNELILITVSKAGCCLLLYAIEQRSQLFET